MSEEITRARMEEREICAARLEWMASLLPEGPAKSQLCLAAQGLRDTVEFRAWAAGRASCHPIAEHVEAVSCAVADLTGWIEELAAALGGATAGLFAEDGWQWRIREIRERLYQARRKAEGAG